MAVPLIFLPGALGAFEGSEAAIARLGRTRPILPIGYTADDDYSELIARILAAAEASGAAKVDLLGQSYGGWIAQCFVRLHPQRARRLVLSHSFTLQPRHRWQFILGRWAIRHLPRALARRLLLARVGRALRPVREIDPDLHLRQLAAQARSGALFDILAAQQSCMAQSLRTPAPPLVDGLPVLIVESDDDPLVPRAARAALRRQWPDAMVRSFDRGGHISALTRTDDYVLAVERFLDAC